MSWTKLFLILVHIRIKIPNVHGCVVACAENNLSSANQTRNFWSMPCKYNKQQWKKKIFKYFSTGILSVGMWQFYRPSYFVAQTASLRLSWIVFLLLKVQGASNLNLELFRSQRRQNSHKWLYVGGFKCRMK